MFSLSVQSLVQSFINKFKKELGKRRDPERRLRSDIKAKRFRSELAISDRPEAHWLKLSHEQRVTKFQDAQIFKQGVQEQILAPSVIQPDVYLVVERGVKVVAQTDGFIKDGTLFHFDILKKPESRSHFKSRSLGFSFGNDGAKALIPKALKSAGRVSSLSLSLLSEHGYNYYHFLTEILPRVVLLNQTPQFLELVAKSGELTVLVDESVPQQVLQYLDIALDVAFKIHKVRADESYDCEALVYCSPFFDPMDNVDQDKALVEDYYADEFALRLVKTLFDDAFESKLEPKRKFFLARKPNLARRMLNAEELECFMQERGFELIYPEDYSLAEQVSLFQQAECVVGASGAAFTNILHMSPGANALMFSASVSNTNYFLFQGHADVAGVNLYHVLTTSVDDNHALHDDAVIDLDDLGLALQNIEPITTSVNVAN